MSASEQPLASLSLTHVHYNPTDIVSYASAWLALVPQVLCVTYVALIWASREVEIILMFAGQLGCEALNFALKRLIREERPKYMHGKGYGMPSSHAQFVAYFSCYITLFLLLRHKPNFSVTPNATTFIQRAAVSVLACVGASAVAISRLYLNYHTKKQVLAGFAAGVLLSVAWFFTISFLRTTGWIDWALEFPLSRALRVRDLVVSEDLTEAGWQRWEARRMLKQREDSESSRKSK
ncbi:PAP2 domain protein [Talaromyces proteolyticus]|uniref:Dolichyldiphosphatase n=1 Tax=Talaromyces proteolyticus TaxID=1131652 RepID=A0AAD4PWI5_9EURO|nr:PAP2 domain protein [Talaromyces proteolyticus]KAH8695125.1 PAP2 domain protein [Talaromyces proteolyticus]